MKKLTLRRMHAFLLAVSMMICMVGFDYRVEASETGSQTDGTVELTVPQNVREEDGFIVWDKVEDAYAYGYTVQISKGEDTREYEWYENKNEWRRFIYQKYNMPDFGNYEFRVCALDETGAATKFSDPVTVSYQAEFSMPVNVKVSESDSRRLTWDEVKDAVRYNIKIYKNDESHSLYYSTYVSYNSFLLWEDAGEYLVTVQAMDKDYHVSEWTEEVLTKIVERPERPRLAEPQNVCLDGSGENIIWDEVENADYYYVGGSGFVSSIKCEQPMLENWKRYISPWNSWYDGKQHIWVSAYSNSDFDASYSSEDLTVEYIPVRDESITVPQIQHEGNSITWGEAENAFRYLYRMKIDEDVYNTSWCNKEYRNFLISNRYPEGDYEFELCVIDEKGNYNSTSYSFTLDTTHDESVWVPKLYYKFEKLVWDYDDLRHPETWGFWLRIRRQRDDVVIKLTDGYSGVYYGLMDLDDEDYKIEVCTIQNGYKLGEWTKVVIEKHGEGLFDKEKEISTDVEISSEAVDIPEEDRITSITINPAFNMKGKDKDGNDVELDLSKIKIKAKEIYDEEGLKRAEEALGETLNGNKHYNLLDLTLWHDEQDISKGYDGLVKVIIPIPNGHRDKKISCYRLTEGEDGEVTKQLIPGDQTEDSYIIYLEHFSKYAVVAAGSDEQDPPEGPCEQHTYTDWESDDDGHWQKCDVCGEETEKDSHIKVDGTVIKQPTQTETGIMAYECSVCGCEMGEGIIDKLPEGGETHTHTYTNWITSGEGHWQKCDVCGEETEKESHIRDAGTVAKQPTQTETGIMIYKCSVCGYDMGTGIIDKLPTPTETEDPGEIERRDITDKKWFKSGIEFTEAKYTGDEICPTVSILYRGIAELVEDVDYQVTYLKNKNCGTATVIVTGINDYQGTLTFEFKITMDMNKTFAVGNNKYKVTNSTSATFMGVKSKSASSVVIPGKVKIGGLSYKVTAISNKALRNNKHVKNVIIGSNVKTIGNSAFERCTKLETLQIGSKVTSIGAKAFYKCSKLTDLTIPSKVTKIGKQAFYDCKNIKDIIIETKKLTSKNVGSKAFKGVGADADIEVPASKLEEYRSLLRSKGVHADATYTT